MKNGRKRTFVEKNTVSSVFGFPSIKNAVVRTLNIMDSSYTGHSLEGFSNRGLVEVRQEKEAAVEGSVRVC